ncbi:MAG TPA: hypothetical protein VGQ25_01215 [Gemmatimonadales bacterium]|nr:hypothetical protein [Gemmatimonadales bacterium]
MALGLTRWVATTFLGLGAVALAYLPPRGARADRYRSHFVVTPVLRPTAARLRVQGLAEEWRTARAAVRLMESRQEVAAAARRPTVLLTGSDSIPAAARQRVAAALDTIWRHLGLGETKVTVGVIIELSVLRPEAPRTPIVNRETPAYLLPDSTDRSTCIALIPAGIYWTRVILGEVTPGRPSGVPHLQLWLKSVLGPCAFYAAFGAPGKPVLTWLSRRGFDLALYPDWDATPGAASSSAGFMMYERRTSWFWDFVYHQSFTAVGCLAGRSTSCRAAVVESADRGPGDSVPRLIVSHRSWWRQQQLVGGERYLADVAREVGRERFLRFWNSSLPVDTALAAALRAPVGEWSARWQRRFGPRLPLGPAAPLSAMLLGIVLGGAAVASVVLTASRREVR